MNCSKERGPNFSWSPPIFEIQWEQKDQSVSGQTSLVLARPLPSHRSKPPLHDGTSELQSWGICEWSSLILSSTIINRTSAITLPHTLTFLLTAQNWNIVASKSCSMGGVCTCITWLGPITKCVPNLEINHPSFTKGSTRGNTDCVHSIRTVHFVWFSGPEGPPPSADVFSILLPSVEETWKLLLQAAPQRHTLTPSNHPCICVVKLNLHPLPLAALDPFTDNHSHFFIQGGRSSTSNVCPGASFGMISQMGTFFLCGSVKSCYLGSVQWLSGMKDLQLPRSCHLLWWSILGCPSIISYVSHQWAIQVNWRQGFPRQEIISPRRWHMDLDEHSFFESP